MSYPLGATITAASANFSLFSGSATRVELLFFNWVEDPRPSRIIELDPRAQRTYHYWPEGLVDSAPFAFARAFTYEIMNLYAVKMAAVFMISTSTLALRTGFTQRWIAFLGLTFALLLLISGRNVNWIMLVFPVWVLLSASIS